MNEIIENQLTTLFVKYPYLRDIKNPGVFLEILLEHELNGEKAGTKLFYKYADIKIPSQTSSEVLKKKRGEKNE